MTIKEVILDFLHKEYVKDKKRFTLRKSIEILQPLRVYSGHTVTRRCQELAEDGMIDRVEQKNAGGTIKRTWYRWKKQPKNMVWKK